MRVTGRAAYCRSSIAGSASQYRGGMGNGGTFVVAVDLTSGQARTSGRVRHICLHRAARNGRLLFHDYHP
ncbi:hypothetical protein GCM10009804_03310 [Kribbella hippodromi]|uniref:Uncharacterized protein n=1 Tax=Kribbella hippodromi TaxID=434347 RepID=A0ABN2BZC2_9ACTN